MARPTDYTPELVEKAREYVEKHYTEHRFGEKLSMPSIADLALELGVHRDTIYSWSKEHEEFSDITSRLMTLQEVTLSENGLTKRFDSGLTKLMLSKHGYRESSDITTDGKALPTPILGAATKDEHTN